MNRQNNRGERGAVSLFIVIFTALLVTVVATSFIQIMLKNQQQASNNNLSQSAYESALAGVEDAKRALVYMNKCEQGTAGPAGCDVSVRNALKSGECDSLGQTGAKVVTFDANNEVPVGTDAALNQAYTCVKVILDTNDVKGTLAKDGDSTVVRLAGTGAFDRIKISWFSPVDLGYDPSNPSSVTATPTFFDQTKLRGLPAVSEWLETSPPILRTQLLEFNTTQTLDQLAGLSKTLFLYPYDDPTGSPALDFATDKRMTAGSTNAPQLTACAEDFTSGGGRAYLCSATIRVPSDSNQKFLQLTSIYNHTDFSIQLYNGATPVPFDSVQPVVDSTGRASDQFRRVKARVSIDALPKPYPNAALSLDGDLCKNFFVTNDSGDYKAECSP